MTVLFTVSLHSTSSGLHTADIIIKCLPCKGLIGFTLNVSEPASDE